MNRKIIALLFTLFLISTEGFGQLRPSLDGLKLERTLQLIKNLYVDDVDSEKLTETAIRAMLSDLDPHSSYLDKEEVKAMNEPLQGDFEGIGISFNMLTDTLYVMEVISGGPSQKVGILPGDKILYVNDTLIAGVKMNTNDVIGKLRGPKGTEVKVKVLRRGVPQLLEFRIIRDKIPIYSIDASYMVDNNTGYIRLSRFAATSADEFRKAENALLAAGMTNLILDLTGNGGGILQTATDITDEFLEKGKLIVYTEGKNQPRYSINSTDKGNFKKGNLVVLVDEGSASASEILSGAVQDWDRGVIVGRRTFGKGLVQRQLPLPDGTMIRLTVARYYTPTGRSIQKPYENGDLESYNMDVLNRYNRGELIHADSIHFPDSLKYKTLVNKRTVYGGGGIMPDYFVPLDTATLTNLHRDLIAKGIVNRISISEVDRNRKTLLATYPDAETFKKEYGISPQIIDNLKQMAAADSIKWDDEQFERSQSLLFTQLKALIARDLYNSSAYFRIMNDENEIFKEAFRIINDEERYNNLLKGLANKVSSPNS